MNSHVYKFGGKLRLQSGNGSIGDRATGIIAQFVMIWWERNFKNKLQLLNINVDLLKRFIDDVNIVCDEIKPGTEYCDGVLAVNEEKEILDRDRPIDLVTMEVVRKVADDVSDMLKFTTDVPSNHNDKRMPVLDMKVRLDEENEIEYIFYEKPMKIKIVVGKSSALPNNVKKKTLTQEVFRRLHNTRDKILDEHKAETLSDFMVKLKTSGYNEKERFEILRGGINTYEKIRKLEKEGKREFYRPPNVTSNEIKIKRNNKNDWYKRKKPENKFTSVMFVEATPNGELIKTIRKAEELNKISDDKRIKFVEKSGRKLIDTMRQNDPFRKNCVKECLACEKETKFTNCKKTNVGYTIQCKLCKSRGITKVYKGETARSMYLRQKEHVQQLKNKKTNSVMFKHTMKDHENEIEKVDFEMKLAGVFKTPLERIINEGVRIKERKPEELLNSKMEFFGPSVKRKTFS